MRSDWLPRQHARSTKRPIFLLHFFNVHIMNVNYAKYPKKFDSRTISGELP